MKFKDYINEGMRLAVGDYIQQVGSDYIAYGKITQALKNGSFKAVVFMSIDGKTSGKAKITSIKGWYPDPVKINEKDVPWQILDKIHKRMG
jgi:hypothetical protein